MNSEKLIHTIDLMKQRTATGNMNLMLNTPQDGHLSKMKEDAIEHLNGERNEEKWKVHLQCLAEDMDLTDKQFKNLSSKVIAIFEDIMALKSPCSDIQSQLTSGQYNVNNVFEIMVKFGQSVQEIINHIRSCESEYPSVFEETQSSEYCALFFLSLMEVQLNAYVEKIPKDISQIDKNVEMYASLFEFMNNYTLSNSDKNQESQLKLLMGCKSVADQYYNWMKDEINGSDMSKLH